MSIQQTFDKLWELIKQDQNYLPPNYQTIGGMWTTEIWELHGVRAMLQDEGFTRSIAAFDTYAYQTGLFPIQMYRGNQESLENVLNKLLQLQ